MHYLSGRRVYAYFATLFLSLQAVIERLNIKLELHFLSVSPQPQASLLHGRRGIPSPHVVSTASLAFLTSFWSALLRPGPHLKARPQMYRPGSVEHMRRIL